jgi:hypothetical protein
MSAHATEQDILVSCVHDTMLSIDRSATSRRSWTYFGALKFLASANRPRRVTQASNVLRLPRLRRCARQLRVQLAAEKPAPCYGIMQLIESPVGTDAADSPGTDSTPVRRHTTKTGLTTRTAPYWVGSTERPAVDQSRRHRNHPYNTAESSTEGWCGRLIVRSGVCKQLLAKHVVECWSTR